MKIKIKIEKKHAFLLGILTIVLAGVLLINAVTYPTYNSNLAPDNGHGGDRIWIRSTDNTEKTLQAAITQGDLTKKKTQLVITHSADYSCSANTCPEINLGPDNYVCFLEEVSGTGNIGCDVYKLSGTYRLDFPSLRRNGVSTCRAQCWKFSS